MNDEMIASRKERFNEDDHVSLQALVFSLILFLILGMTPFLNSTITKILRPIMIFVCVLHPKRYPWRLNKAMLAFCFYLLYMTAIFLTHKITGAAFSSWISILLFGLFFAVASQRVWSPKEIRMFFFTVFLACLVYSLVLLFYNPSLFHISGSLLINGKKINSNAASYTVAQGALCGMVLLFNYGNRRRPVLAWKTILVLGTLQEIYILLALGQRGGFFSVCIGGFLIAWEHMGTKGRAGNVVLRVFLILAAVLILRFVPAVTADTHAQRLFDYENLLDDNGRDDLNRRAMEMIREKPVFGGGYGYWERESGIDLGLHNGFLYIMVIGGYLAGFLVGLFLLFFLLDAFHQRSMIPFAFLILAMVHLFEDSGLDYYSYIPMILAYILILKELFGKRRTGTLFIAG